MIDARQRVDAPAWRLNGGAIVTAIGLIIAGVLLLNLLFMPFSTDQAIFAAMGRVILEGGVPYRDVFDIKPPGIYLIYALAQGFFGPSDIGHRLFELLAWLVMGLGFYRLTLRVCDGRAAILSFTIAVIGMLLFGHANVGQAETYGAVILVWAIVFSLPGSGGTGTEFWRWVAAAALYTFAGLLKPPLGAGILTGFALALHGGWRPGGLSGIWRPVFAYTIGAGGIMGATLVYLVLSGAWPSFVQALFVYVPGYVTQLYGEADGLTVFLLGTAKFCIDWAMIPLAALLLILHRGSPRQLALVMIPLGTVILGALIGVALQIKFFPYQYGTVVALASLPAGWGLWALWERLPRGVISGPVFAGFSLVLAFATEELREFWLLAGERSERIVQASLAGELPDPVVVEPDLFDPPAYEVAAWLAAQPRKPDEDGLFLWGLRPLIYHYSGLEPVSRHIMNQAQRASWSLDWARPELIAELEARRPWAIVVQWSDHHPLVVGEWIDSRATMIRDFPQLRELLTRDYQLRVQYLGYDIYTRRPEGSVISAEAETE